MPRFRPHRQAPRRRKRTQSAAARRQELISRKDTGTVNLEQAQADFRVAQANVTAAQASLDLARINQGSTTIVSPIIGKIGRVLITKGNFVGPSAGSLVQIVQFDPIRVVFSLSEQLRDSSPPW